MSSVFTSAMPVQATNAAPPPSGSPTPAVWAWSAS